MKLASQAETVYSNLKRASHAEKLEDIQLYVKRALHELESLNTMARLRGCYNIRNYSEDVHIFASRAQHTENIEEARESVKKALHPALEARDIASGFDEDDD
ncbi:MAG: hypothetical protein KGZ58_07235 [Ignavibacteriales bacterium]|nr:hypothetical protein [Ignavibacteriales bacterium]